MRGNGVVVLLPPLLLVLLLLSSIAGLASAGSSKQCGPAADPAAEPEYNYSDVFSRDRDQGIAFAS